ncbi:uncharacterized protein CCOS01_09374 [Colletotrichum costaricense]|uniref:Uncharacterized protein n=2 Tax=Colletotrichum acutatum species complex TaxID=2707335 RepID=A0AAI9YVA0_9PEZI|nr:uncharacterized protein CCOS01_09374 [Colletotrichum costaricense]XP_060374691.1 uncharacterized protein CTAM01_14721 [Colletotrichum tamarilloi]KAI3535944.1 hypothetical protein CSPX01_11101 [Colletotrichum filicis]KAK1479297.1 hypothetical protein CTAM01_14721 [Colletotrichum tamarilloi]KAK1524287.1 hypothetical protein CCOS01_09374 [Colletotrichum costaricense]
MHPPPADCLEAMIGSLEAFLWGVGPVRPGCGQHTENSPQNMYWVKQARQSPVPIPSDYPVRCKDAKYVIRKFFAECEYRHNAALSIRTYLRVSSQQSTYVMTLPVLEHNLVGPDPTVETGWCSKRGLALWSLGFRFWSARGVAPQL